MTLFFLVELSALVSYLFSGTLGLCLSLLAYIVIFTKKDRSFLDKLLVALIFSSPTFNIGFAGQDQHHMFSWCSILLGILIAYLFYNYFHRKVGISGKTLLISASVLGIIFINCFFEINPQNALFEWIQICSMFLPLILVYDQKKYLATKISLTQNGLVQFINFSILATALAMIIQYILYKNLAILVGNWTFYPDRTTVDFLFAGYSVLSLFLSLGIVINIKILCNKFAIIPLVYAGICLLAIVINSSRTGLAIAVVLSLIIIFPQIFKTANRIFIVLLTSPVVFVILNLAIDAQLESRESSSLFDANGRFETYSYGMSMLTRNSMSLLFGSGISLENYTKMIPHNFILETLVNTGIIVTITIVGLLISLLRYINKNEYKYIIWGIFVGSMFITNFPGNTFATIYIVVIILSTNRTNNDLRKLMGGQIFSNRPRLNDR
jgi:hypothetical protein